MRFKKKLNNLNKLYIFFFYFVLFININSISKASANSFKINDLEISEPFGVKFNKEKVINRAFKDAFIELISMITTSSDQKKIKKTPINTVKTLIDSFTMSDEKFIDDMYIVNFDVNFNKKKTLKFFESKNIFPSIPRKKTVLLMPVFVDMQSNQISIFNDLYGPESTAMQNEKTLRNTVNTNMTHICKEIRNNPLKAKVQIEVKKGTEYVRQDKVLSGGADLYKKSGGNKKYEGLIIEEIHAGNNFVSVNGVQYGLVAELDNREEVFRSQIRETIKIHFEKHFHNYWKYICGRIWALIYANISALICACICARICVNISALILAHICALIYANISALIWAHISVRICANIRANIYALI